MEDYFNECVKNMKEQVIKLELSDWLKNYSPDEDKGFMWCNHENINKIANYTASDSHSGCSFAICIRKVQKELKGGI